MMRTQKSMVWAGLVAAALALPACDTDRSTRDTALGPDAAIGLSVEPTRDRMAVGEVITVAAETQNLLGRDAEIEWEAAGGHIDVQDNGRIARVRFDEPGTKEVSAKLFVDGRLVRRDSTTITVRPLR